MWIGILVAVDGRDGLSQRSPDAVVVHPRRHHEDEAFILADLPCGNDLHLHGGIGRAVALLADAPGMHPGRNMAERRNLADVIKVLHPALVGRGGSVLAAAVMEVLTAGKQEISLRQSSLFCIAPLVHGRTGPRPRGILTLSHGCGPHCANRRSARRDTIDHLHAGRQEAGLMEQVLDAVWDLYNGFTGGRRHA